MVRDKRESKGELCGSVRRVVRESAEGRESGVVVVRRVVRQSGEGKESCVVVSDVWSERAGKVGRAVW